MRKENVLKAGQDYLDRQIMTIREARHADQDLRDLVDREFPGYPVPQQSCRSTGRLPYVEFSKQAMATIIRLSLSNEKASIESLKADVVGLFPDVHIIRMMHVIKAFYPKSEEGN